MAKIIVVANQKGGVGKTASAVSFLAGLKDRGYKVLGIDLDPQGHFSTFMGVRKDLSSVSTIYNVLRGDCGVPDAIYQTHNGDIVPANILLAGAEQEFTSIGKEYKLAEALKAVQDQYDFIVIDTTPALGLLTMNAFTAGDFVIIPVDSDEGSIDGLVQLNQTIEMVKQYCNSHLQIAGIFFNAYNARTKLGKSLFKIAEAIADQIGTKVFKTYIRRSETMPQSRTAQINIFEYKPQSTIAIDFNNLLDEVLATIN